MADERVQALKEPIDVAEYLFKRLREVGVLSVHGVPGDYNLVALDYLPDCGLKWVGSVNELNAGEFAPLLPPLHISPFPSHHIMTSRLANRGGYFLDPALNGNILACISACARSFRR